MLYENIIRKLLFMMDAEKVHHKAMYLCSQLSKIPFNISIQDPCLEQRVFGIKFKNPVGIAAGLDKDGKAFKFFEKIGFGCTELGTVTSEFQPGNPMPRIFRLPADQALINRMGFPSVGVDNFIENIQELKSRESVLGINLGKAKSIPIDKALSDYLYTFSRLSEYADYLVLNISSPNTPELRKLQEPERLKELFLGIEENNLLKKPILIKIAPDLSSSELSEILKVCVDCKVKGIIATNTTFSREGLITKIDEVGGLSGKPLKPLSISFVSRIYSELGETLPIVAAGGIFNAQDVIDYIRAGASLTQIYTGFVYGGPFTARKICKDLVDFCNKNSIKSISEIRGKR